VPYNFSHDNDDDNSLWQAMPIGKFQLTKPLYSSISNTDSRDDINSSFRSCLQTLDVELDCTQRDCMII